MNPETYFEQFVGDVKTYSMWNDERVGKILEEAGVLPISWTAYTDSGGMGIYQCHMISNRLTADELVTKLLSVEKRYELTDINTYKPEWRKDTETHAHFKVKLD